MNAPTFRDMQNCCAREVNKRRHVYPRLVAAEKMTQAKADQEIATMDSCVKHFKALADTEDAKGRLL